MSEHDNSIVTRLRAGDREALAEFIQQNHASIMAFLQKRIGSHLRTKIEPEDILQEVGVEAVRALPQIRLEVREPLNWLFQIAERKIIDAHRHFFASQKRDAAREAAPGPASHGGLEQLLIASMTTPSQAFSRDQRQLRMLAALESLPEEQREALRLRYLVGLPSKEVAGRLGKTDGAVRVMLSRGLGRLQQLMDDR